MVLLSLKVCTNEISPDLPLLHEVQVAHSNLFSPSAIEKCSTHSYLLLLVYKKLVQLKLVYYL